MESKFSWSEIEVVIFLLVSFFSFFLYTLETGRRVLQLIVLNYYFLNHDRTYLGQLNHIFLSQNASLFSPRRSPPPRAAARLGLAHRRR